MENLSFNRKKLNKFLVKIKSGPNEKFGYSNLGYYLLRQVIDLIEIFLV